MADSLAAQNPQPSGGLCPKSVKPKEPSATLTQSAPNDRTTPVTQHPMVTPSRPTGASGSGLGHAENIQAMPIQTTPISAIAQQRNYSDSLWNRLANLTPKIVATQPPKMSKPIHGDGVESSDFGVPGNMASLSQSILESRAEPQSHSGGGRKCCGCNASFISWLNPFKWIMATIRLLCRIVNGAFNKLKSLFTTKVTNKSSSFTIVEEDDVLEDDDFLSSRMPYHDEKRERKKRRFWTCGKKSFWTSYVAILWYICLAFTVFTFLNFYIGPWSGDARFSVLNNIHSMADVAPFSESTHSVVRHVALGNGWAQEDAYDKDGRWIGVVSQTQNPTTALLDEQQEQYTVFYSEDVDDYYSQY